MFAKEIKRTGRGKSVYDFRALSFCGCCCGKCYAIERHFRGKRYKVSPIRFSRPESLANQGIFRAYCVTGARLFLMRSAACLRVIRFRQSGQYFLFPGLFLSLRGRFHNAREPQEGIELRLSAAEGNEILDGIAARAALENFREEPPARLRVENAFLFESAEAVGREHFRPFVAVVARGVAARENVREALREAVPLWRKHHGDLFAHGVEKRRNRTRLRVEFRMKEHVEEREFDLTHAEGAGFKVLRRDHLREELVGKGLARIGMTRNRLHHIVLPGEILEELARELNRIPFDAVDAGNLRLFLGRENVVERVAEFMKERRHLVVRHRRFLSFDRSGKVGDEVGDGRDERAV